LRQWAELESLGGGGRRDIEWKENGGGKGKVPDYPSVYSMNPVRKKGGCVGGVKKNRKGGKGWARGGLEVWGSEKNLHRPTFAGRRRRSGVPGGGKTLQKLSKKEPCRYIVKKMFKEQPLGIGVYYGRRGGRGVYPPAANR